MYRFLCVHFVLFMVFSSFSAVPIPKRWHETKGFGISVKGGLAGEVYKVTNLNSSGPGSLKDAVSKSNRLIVFEVGGVITGGVNMASDITIAGETAPYPGITVIKGNVRSNEDNIVVSHITIASGSADEGHHDACNIGGKNVVYNHVSAYWGKDETLSIKDVLDVTLYKCIIAEGLQFSGHEDGEHSKGLHIQSGNDRLSVIGCLCANSAIRNPRIDRSTSFIANHVVYNFAPAWDHVGPKLSSDDEIASCDHCFRRAITAHQGQNTLVGCVALHGPESKAEFFLDAHHKETSGYLKDNIIKDRQGNDLKQANTEGVFTGGFGAKVTLLDTPPIWPEGMVPLPAEEALYEVLRTAGPHPGNRNPQNARVVKTVADDNGVIIDSENEVGGYPDYQETRHSLTVPDGVEARQKWLDELEDKVAVDTEIDLSRLYSIVGSEASDKLRGPTPVVQQSANRKSGVAGIKIAQKYSGYKQLHAAFSLSVANSVSMKVFDLAGNMVAHQPLKIFQAGSNEMVINVEHLSAGLYVCRFQIGTITQNLSYNCIDM